MVIRYNSEFVKQYSKLPEYIKDISELKIGIFISNPFLPVLRTHKLTGKLSGFWSFSISYRYRVIFEFLINGDVKFHSIGGHEIYR